MSADGELRSARARARGGRATSADRLGRRCRARRLASLGKWRNPIGMVGAAIIVLQHPRRPARAATSGRSTRTSSSLLRFEDPSWAHPMGTDELGRDTLARIIHGAQVSLQVGIISVVDRVRRRGRRSACWPATTRAIVDTLLMRIVDIMFALPGIVLAIVIAGLLGPNRRNAMIAIGIVILPAFARVVRGAVLEVMGFPYTESARALGASGRRIMGRHVIPNIARAAARARHRLPLGRDPGRGGAQLPRARHAATGGVVGRDAEQRREPTSTSTPWLSIFPGARDHDRRARLQLPRRRPARHPRSPARPARRRRLGQEVGRVLDVLISGRLGRRRSRQPALPRRRRDRGRARSPRSAGSARRDRRARDRRHRQGRLPRLRRPAQPQRLLDPREPDRREHDPPGRHDRGRRQLRLELRAGHGRTPASP